MSAAAPPPTASATATPARVHPIRALVEAWLLLDFFGAARRTGSGVGSTLTTTVFSQSFLAFLLAALLYPDPPLVPFAAANLCVSTLFIALSAFDTEPPLQRRAVDRVLLSTSPLSRVQALTAHALHQGFGTGLVTIGMALPAGILLACNEHDLALLPLYLLAALLCAGLATASLTVALRLCRRILGHHGAALIAGTGKALVLAFGVVFLLLSLPALRHDASALPFGRLGAELLPPYHCAKLLAEPAAQLWRLVALLSLAAILFVLASLLGDDERVRRTIARRDGPLARLLLRLCPDRQQAALAAFTATMLWRSPGLRARLLPLLGIPAAVAFLALRGTDEKSRLLFSTMSLQFPAIYLPFVAAALLPTEQPGSRWLFDSAPGVPIASIRRAVWLALVLRVLLPVHALALLGLVTGGLPLRTALPLSIFAFGLGAAVARAMVRQFREVPFTQENGDGRIDFGDLMAFGVAIGIGSALVAVMGEGVRIAAAAIALAVLVLMMRPGAATAHADAAEPASEPAAEPPAAAAPGSAAPPRGPQRAPAPQSLRRELAAIAVLYAVQSTLPLLVGLVFAKGS